jgi:copper oxidase (laccase) domain-containing protein
MLHAGWRGTAAGILGVAVRRLAALRRPARELRVLLGPAICGRCYEVSPDVYGQLTGRAVGAPTTVSLHEVLADLARTLGVREVHATALCTRCDNDRLFSHRAGDAGRQLGVLVADPG